MRLLIHLLNILQAFYSFFSKEALRPSPTKNKWYIGGTEYKDGSLEAIYNEEGRVIPDGSDWQYEYTLSDHLGNAWVSFSDKNGDGVIDSNINTSNEILQTQSYYPF